MKVEEFLKEYAEFADLFNIIEETEKPKMKLKCWYCGHNLVETTISIDDKQVDTYRCPNNTDCVEDKTLATVILANDVREIFDNIRKRK